MFYRRFDDYAGDLGAVGDRRPQARDPAFEHYVVPLTVFILVALFSVQSSGTARVAACFGPVMVVWFAAIAVLRHRRRSRDDPTVLLAINPLYGIEFLLTHGTIGLVTLGAVFLAVTGGEALYADLGHFGKQADPVRLDVLRSAGAADQLFRAGRAGVADPKAIDNSFYRMAPDVLLLPLVALATAATVIASQAVITGAYSLIRQAVQLGLLPRFEVRYTSETHAGQIYLPRVNRLLLIGVLLLVLLFRTSSDLASAYGIAVSTHHGRRRHHGLCRDLEIVELARGDRGRADRAVRRRRHELLCRQSAETV